MKISENYNTITSKQLAEKIANWQQQFVDDINQNYLNKNYTDAIVAAAMINSLVKDVQVLMQWCETIAHKLSDIEKNTEIPLEK